MGSISELNPKSVFKYFELICSVPHGSGNTGKIADLCVDFSRAHNLKVYRDDFNNIVIYKGGSAGYEDCEPVIIQGHLDMVCAKTDGNEADMSKVPVEPFIDGDYIRAKNTSLGGDDGIAVAMALSILEDDTLCHPPLEVLLTSDEESGMTGAEKLDYSVLKGKRLINIDSEEEGIITVSCAGGVHVETSIPVSFEDCDEEKQEVKVEGLLGGHSGIEISKPGHENAMIVLAKKLSGLRKEKNIRISGIKCGSYDNVIPSKAYVTLGGEKALSVSDSNRIIDFLTNVPNGVIQKSDVFEDLVHTSLNLGIAALDDSGFHTTHLIRSAVNKDRDELKEKLCDTVSSFGGTVKTGSNYPAWEYRKDSNVRETAINAYYKLFGKKPVIAGTHGGLECGLFYSKIKGLDCISIGPDLFDVHSPEERLKISSVGRIYNLLTEILKGLS